MKLVKVVLVIAIILCMVAGITFAAAGGGGGGGGGFGGGGGGMGRGMGGRGRGIARGIAAQAETYTLTDDQVAKLNAVTPTDPNLGVAVQTAQTALTAAVIAGDEAKIKEAVKGVAAAMEKQALAQVKEYQAVKGILTPAQYKQMADAATAPPGRRGAGGRGAGGGGGRGTN